MLSAGFWCPKTVPTQVKCKHPSGKRWDDSGRHDQLMQEIALSRNTLLLILFCLLRLHRCQASFCHDAPNQRTQRSNQFGVEADKRTAQKPAAMVSECVLANLPCKNTRHNNTKSVNVSWPKWPPVAAMVPHSWQRCRQQLPRMLANCCVRQHESRVPWRLWDDNGRLGHGQWGAV